MAAPMKMSGTAEYAESEQLGAEHRRGYFSGKNSLRSSDVLTRPKSAPSTPPTAIPARNPSAPCAAVSRPMEAPVSLPARRCRGSANDGAHQSSQHGADCQTAAPRSTAGPSHGTHRGDRNLAGSVRRG